MQALEEALKLEPADEAHPAPEPAPVDLTALGRSKRTYAINAARDNPVAFIALCLGRAVSDLQRGLLAHALGNAAWYAELPRGHAKTSTLAYLAPWFIGHRPNLRVKVIGQNDDQATRSTRFMRDIVQLPLFRLIFPHVELKPGENTLTAWSVVAKGMPPQRDPTVDGAGIFGRTGGRADIEWFDDICDLRNSILQPALRGQVKEAYANVWLPMLDPSAAHKSRLWRTATPFHTDDLTADWRRECGQDGTLFRRPCRGLESPWPEVFTPEVLAYWRGKMGPMAYARAYELIPISTDLLVFRPEWLRYHAREDIPAGTRTIAAIDWGYGRKRQERDDPDYSVCIVAEVDYERRAFLTDILRVRESFPEFKRMARELVERRGCQMVLAEANGPQKGVFDQFRSECRQSVVAVERTADKHLRAAGSQPFVEQGKLSLPKGTDGQVDPAFAVVVEELLAFPAGSHDDTVDCIVDLCAAAASGTISKPGGAVTVNASPARLFDSRPTKRRMFG